MNQDFLENHKPLSPEEAGIALLQGDEEGPIFEGATSAEDAEKIDSKENLLARYLKESARFDLLTPEEEKELALATRNGDEKAALIARKKLATGNLRLVVKIAHDYSGYWTRDFLDLVQEGNVGLLQAVKKFDPDKGVKFSYYASFWIKAYILKYIMDNWRLVKLGTTQAQRKLFYNLKREKEKLAAEGFEVTSDLIAEAIGVTEAEVQEMDQRMGGWDLSLESTLKHDSEETHKDCLADEALSPEEQILRANLLEWLGERLGEFRETISRREVFILDRRLLSDPAMTLEEIGSHFSVSRERIRQNENRLIEKLLVFVGEIRSRLLPQKSPEDVREKEEIDIMAKRGGLTTIFSQTTAVRLREVEIQNLEQLKGLSSDQFVSKVKKLQKHQLTVRAVAEKMAKKGLFFSDGEEATRNLIEYDSKYYEPSRKVSPPPEPPLAGKSPADAGTASLDPALSAASSPGLAASVSGQSAGSENSFEAVLQRIGKALDPLAKGEHSLSDISFSGYFQGPDGKRYKISIEKEAAAGE